MSMILMTFLVFADTDICKIYLFYFFHFHTQLCLLKGILLAYVTFTILLSVCSVATISFCGHTHTHKKSIHVDSAFIPL